MILLTLPPMSANELEHKAEKIRINYQVLRGHQL